MKTLLLALLFTSSLAIAQESTCGTEIKTAFEEEDYATVISAAKNCDEVEIDTALKFKQTYAWMLLKMYEKAIPAYRKLIDKNPAEVTYVNGLGSAFLLTRQYDSAEVYFDKAITIDPYHKFVYYNKGMLYLNTDQGEKAVKALEEHTLNHENDGDGWAGLADAYALIKDNDNALSCYAQGIKVDPKNKLAYTKRSDFYYEQGEYEKAISDLKTLLKFYPKEGQYYADIGYIYYQRDNLHFKDAIKWYKKALNYEENANWYGTIGSCYDFLEEYDAAIENYKKSIELGTDESDNYGDLAFLIYLEDDYLEALKYINIALEMAPDDDLFHYTKGIIYSDLEEYSKAIAAFTDAINLMPTDVDYLEERAYAYEMNDNFESAKKDLEKMIELDPNNANAYYHKGNLEMNWRNYNAAVKDFTKAIEIDSKMTNAYINRAVCNFKLSNMLLVCKDMEMAAQLGDTEAKKYIKENCR